jgi:hypothetical protein
MRRFHIYVAVVVLLSLQGCCIWGYQTNSNNQWKPNDTSFTGWDGEAQLRACRASFNKACSDEFRASCERWFKGDVPPVMFGVKPTPACTGPECPGMKEIRDECDTLKKNPKEVALNCPATIDNNEEACMQKNGFHYEESTSLSCRSMRLF